MEVTKIITREQLDELFAKLQSLGYQLVGPTIRDNAIVYDHISSTTDLPTGFTDEQNKGSYRLIPNDNQALFDYNVGPYSWKKFLFPAIQPLFTANKSDPAIKITATIKKENKFAFIGVRACELKAIQIQDKVFSNDVAADSGYNKTRKNSFVVAVNCSKAGNLCFCGAMGTGPKVDDGFDLSLTEIISPNEHYFILAVGTDLGATAIKELAFKDAKEEDIQKANEVCENTKAQLKVDFDNDGVKELLFENLDSSVWDDIEKRCLSCTNCTLVCPTCFCSSVEDSTDLIGKESSRTRKWDSCFNTNFSYMHGGPVRASIKSRYRQWLTHKLAGWYEQFGVSGCVGCGRCISWCPVGIDITEEVAKLRQAKK